MAMTLLLLVEYFFDFAALGCCIYVVLVLFGPISQSLGAGVVQGFYVLAITVLAFAITVEREPAEGQPPCFKHPEIMRRRKPHEDAVIGCCSSTRSRVQRWMVLPALVTSLAFGTALTSALLLLSNGLDDKLAMLMLVATLAIAVVQAVVRACSFRAHLSQNLPFWWPFVYCCLRPGTQRFLRERILLSYYISRAKKVTKPFQDDIQVRICTHRWVLNAVHKGDAWALDQTCVADC